MKARAVELVLAGLHMLESACHGKDLSPDTESDLGGTPDPDEVRSLMDVIGAGPIDVFVGDLPHSEAIIDKRWDIWANDPWEYNVGESEDDSVIGSWIGYEKIADIDRKLNELGLKYVRINQYLF